jgi:N-acetylglucosaminyldiphosphoundecaprenol N-acetyl-beta-D-mannosaminyltransferase
MSNNKPMINVLGIGVHAVNMASTLDLVGAELAARRKGYVCVTGVHGIMESLGDPSLRKILNTAFLNVPDGMPLVWVGRTEGFKQTARVYGPDLMFALCELSVREGWTHFLCGGKEGTAEDLKTRLTAQFPGIRVVGTFCPPFRPLNAEEENRLITQVAAVKPDLFWVGMSTPKQERFMAEYLSKLDLGIMLGVGAAFDVHTGRILDSPAWIKRIGMQWLHRLCQEPKRLWRRYAYIVPAFLFLISLQLLGIRRYEIKS